MVLKPIGSDGAPYTCDATRYGHQYYDTTSGAGYQCTDGGWTAFSGGVSVPSHNTLTGLQGGVATEYYHINASEHSTFQGWFDGTTNITVDTYFGDWNGSVDYYNKSQVDTLTANHPHQNVDNHISSSGESHTYINQGVRTNSDVTHNKLTVTNNADALVIGTDANVDTKITLKGYGESITITWDGDGEQLLFGSAEVVIDTLKIGSHIDMQGGEIEDLGSIQADVIETNYIEADDDMVHYQNEGDADTYFQNNDDGIQAGIFWDNFNNEDYWWINKIPTAFEDEVVINSTLNVSESIEYNGTLITHSNFKTEGAEEKTLFSFDYPTESLISCKKYE